MGLALLFVPGSTMHAQVTAELTGTVQDPSGGVIPGATVTLINQDSHATTVVKTNDSGLYAFPSLVPGTYTLRAEAKGFQSKQVTDISLHAGDQRTVPAFSLTVGSEATTVTVNAAAEMIPVENGQRTDVLDSKDIENLALEGRDTTELLKVLPGATTVSGGLTQVSPEFSDLNVSPNESAIGTGININGVPNRGGTALLSDGVNVIDPGDMASSVAMISPEMTQEVSVQASNFSADIPFGPVVISAISKSGGDHYHGEAYFDARNNILDANDWQDNHQHVAQGPASYYYPGGNFGGPVPGLRHKLFFWGGYERFQQNLGNSAHLSSYIPSPEMMAGDFTNDNADNNTLCPTGFYANPSSNYPEGGWCSDLSGTVFPDGSSIPTNPSSAANSGNRIPAQFLDPGAKALASFWPKANANPATSPGHVNYYAPIPNVNNGWLYRLRVDYNLGDNTKMFISYQQAYSAELAEGNGAHIYWTPGNAIPFPGGGVYGDVYSKAVTGHFVHNFSSTTTDEFTAAWAYGSFPFTVPNINSASKTATGYPGTYGKVFATAPSLLIPSYATAGNFTFPDFSQNDIFENPKGVYAVKKEVPSFNDVLTKVWGRHTVKMGGFEQLTDNYQSNDGTYLNGYLNGIAGQNPNIITGNLLGSPQNPTANFLMGITNSYQENNAAPIADTAYQVTAGFVDDTWKTSNRVTLELGARIEHVGHWYDRDGTGMAVFYPDRVIPDFNDGKIAPGFYWHSIDSGVPLSGQPNRFAYVDPRFGLSYDVFGTGNTVVRGGWGTYRFVTQVNDVDGPLQTAQAVQQYNLPGQKSVMLSQIGLLSAGTCSSQCASGSQTGFDPSDYGQPLTEAYNLTIDQHMKWNSVIDVAYVGNHTSQIDDNSETIEGSMFSAVADQNKTPIGAFFKPDPITGVQSTNPENLADNPTGTGETPTGNSAGDYHPYGVEPGTKKTIYGTNSVYMNQYIGYNNYNGLQVSWIKNTGRLTYDFNGTWSKSLGTSLQENPYNIDLNYGPTAIDRPFVFNSSYTYQTGQIHRFNRVVNGAIGGWTISGISTWQHGGYIPAELGNGIPNYGLTLSYTGLPANAKAQGITTGIGDPTYYGTDETLSGSPMILPQLTCNPTSGLGHYQRVNGKCFALPAIGQQGGRNYPYMSMGAYFDNDLAVYKTFHIHEQQNVQLRVSSFDWLNHPLPEFSSLTPLTLNYTVDYTSKAITPNYNTSTFGVMDTKTQAPYQRIMELDVKYSF